MLHHVSIIETILSLYVYVQNKQLMTYYYPCSQPETQHSPMPPVYLDIDKVLNLRMYKEVFDSNVQLYVCTE